MNRELPLAICELDDIPPPNMLIEQETQRDGGIEPEQCGNFW